MGALKPTGAGLLVEDLQPQEKKDLGFPVGMTGNADAGVVRAVGPAVEIEVAVGDVVFHTCGGPKVGAETMIVGEGCVVAIRKAGD